MLEKWRWTPDIDWGQLGKVDPGWIAVVIALVVGVFTIINVRTAVKAYERGKWISEVATARLVWSVVTSNGYIEEGDEVPTGPRDRQFWWSKDVTTENEMSASTTELRRVSRVNQRSVWTVVEVNNKSAEPIGEVQTRIYDASGRAVVGDMMSYEKVIRPGDTRTWLYVTPAPEEASAFTETVSSELYSSIMFRDSAGLVWWRTETDPPERNESRVATKAYEKAQAQRWQRTTERHADDRAKRRARRRSGRAAKKAAAQPPDAAQQDDSNP